MKKRSRIHIFMIMAIMVLTSMMTMSASAASNRSKAMQAYNRFLKKGYYTSMRNWKLAYFTLADIDRNGIPELITMDDTFRPINVFTYQKGKVRCVSEWAGKVWESDRRGYYVNYNPSQKALTIVDHEGTGLWGYELLRMKNGKMKNVLGISISVHWDRWNNKIRNCGYTKNGREWKRCSYKTYKKYESKYFKGSKVKKAYFVKNTSANRKKKLK